MLRVGERVLLLALSDEPDKHPLGYLSSRLLTDVEGRSAFVTMDCALTSFRDAPPGKRSWEPVEVSDCVFRVEACVDRHDAARASLSHRRLDVRSTGHMGMRPGTPVRYSKAVQLVHEFSGALLCIDVQERAAIEGFAMKVVLKTVEPPSGNGAPSDEWSDTWWELRSPGNVRISQVLHYDEICMHSNRWHRNIQARPTPPSGRSRRATGSAAGGRAEPPVFGGTTFIGDDATGVIDASFTHSLLRVVPYDDCPLLPVSEDDPSTTVTSSTTTPLLLSSSSSTHTSSVSDLGRGGGGIGVGAAGFSGTAPNAGAAADGGGILRGGDVVRLCHLTSKGFLTCESVLPPARRKAGGVGPIGRGGDDSGEWEGAAKKEEGHRDGVRGGSAPFLHVSTTPTRREKLQNASSNCLWVLERTHCALGGRPLRGSSSSTVDHENRWRHKPSSSVGPSSAGNAITGDHHRRHSDSTSAGFITETRGNSAGTGDASGVGAHTGMPALAGGGRDTYAEAVATRRRRQGAGDAVEYVRVKHLASLRYLCVGNKCDPLSVEEITARPAHGAGGEGGQAAEPSRRRGESRKGRGLAPRVGMVTVDSHAAVPAATVFVIRPRTVVGAGVPLNTAADGLDRGLGPDDLVHLQHKDTGLFLSALPHDEASTGGNVGLTVIKSPLTTEYWRLSRAPDRERKATNHIMTALAQLKATLQPFLDEVHIMSSACEEATAVFDIPPPIPPARVLRPATLAVGHFHSVLARGAEWWGDKKPRAVERPAAAAGVPLTLLPAAPEAAVDPGVSGEAPSAGGTGLGGLGERTGRGSSDWPNALSGGGGGGSSGGGNTLEEGGSGRKRDRSMSFGHAGKSAGSSSSVVAGGAGAGAGAGSRLGVTTSVISSLDEFHACPRLKFQLLLREQGIIVTLFDAMEKVFRAQDGILARTLWWDDSETVGSVSIDRPAFRGSSTGGSESGDGYTDWEVARDRSDARHCLRQLVREAMALADFYAKDHPRGKATLERFTPLLAEMIGSGLGACELLATIRRDNPRTSSMVTARRIQEVLATLPESRDLANSMRLLGSICRVGQSLLPSIQGLVAVTVLVSNDSAGATPSSGGGGGSSGGDGSTMSGSGGGGGNGVGDGRDGARTAADAKVEMADPQGRQGGRGGGGGGATTLGNARGLFRYELIRDSPSAGAGLGASDPSTTASTSATSANNQQSFVSTDGTRGIRVRLKRLVEGPSRGRKERQLRELAGETRVSSGEGVLFEAVQEGTGYMSKTIVRVLSRGGAEEPPPGRVGAGASSGAGELLELFVESVRLLSSLCRERHTGNIALVRSLKGTSYEELMDVVRSDTVPLTVRSAFARLVESCHLDVPPLLPQPHVRYVRLKAIDDEDDDDDDISTAAEGSEQKEAGTTTGATRPSLGAGERRSVPRKGGEHEAQRKRLKGVLEFVQQFLYKHTRPGGGLHFDQWKSRVREDTGGVIKQQWEPVYTKDVRRTSGLIRALSRVRPNKSEEEAQQQPSASPPTGRTSRGAVPTSTVSRPLQLTESLRLLGAVLSLLRLALSLLGRRPLGRGKAESDPTGTLFRRLCSLLDFLEDVREMRIGFLDSGGMGGTGGRGAGVGVAAAGGGGGLFGRSFQASHLGEGSVSVNSGVGTDFASTSRLLSSLADEDAVGITDTQVAVMRVLTLMLGHELDGQIDEVLRLAQAYDDDESCFRFRFHAGENMVATFNGEDIWGVVHQSGVGLLAGRVGELTAYNLGKTLLRLAVAGQESGRAGGSNLTARSFALLFRISDQGNQLAREARKVTLLTGHAAAETHRRLAHAVAALRAFSRRRRGRPANIRPENAPAPPSPHPRSRVGSVSAPPANTRGTPSPLLRSDGAPPGNTKARPSPLLRSDAVPLRGNRVTPSPLVRSDRFTLSAGAQGTGGADGLAPFPSQSPLLATSPLSQSLSSEGGASNANSPGDGGGGGDGRGGGGGTSERQSSSSTAMEAWALAAAAADRAAAAAADAAVAAAEAAASAATIASDAADKAALAEENSIVEALQEVRTALAAGEEHAAGDGAEVERVASGVGLAPALLNVLRALRSGSGSGPEMAGAGKSGALAADVMDLLRRLVKSGPNADLRRLLFSNFTMLLSFLKMDSSETAPAATGRRRSVDFDGDSVGDRGGGRRLYFAGPVARLMGAVVDGDAVLVTSVSDEQLTQLARGAARSRETDLLTLLQKLVTCQGAPVPSMQRRVLVSLLRELSLADFHAAYGWEDPRSPPSGTRLHRGDPSYTSTTAFTGPGLMSPAFAAPPFTAYGSNSAREVSWGQEVGQEGTPEGAPAAFARRDSQQHSERWDRGRDSATSGLGFMSALQRALVRPGPGPEAGGCGDGKETTSDRHALELLSILAACCEGKNHFTEVQCRSMVSLEDLVTLLTRRAPGDLRGAPARSRGNTADVTEYLRGEEKRDGKSVAEKLIATAGAGAKASVVLEAAAAAVLSMPQRTSDAAAASSASPPVGRKGTAAAAAAAAARSPLSEQSQSGKEGTESSPPVAVPEGVSAWFRNAPTTNEDGGEGDGVGEAERPLPADVRWALTWLLDSVFFSVKEPVEGLDRHPAVHALLENFLATTQFCTRVPASTRWENVEVNFIISTAVPCIHNFFEGCWRDPLPFVATTARALVSKLAVLFNVLVEDVRSMAENAGLEWRWRKVDGVTVDEGAWEGNCDQGTRARLERRKRKLRPLRDLIFELYLSGDRRKRDLFSQFHYEQLRLQAYNRIGRGESGRVSSVIRGLAGVGDRDSVDGGSDSGSADGDGDGAGGNEDPFHDVFRAIQELDMIIEESPDTMCTLEASVVEPYATTQELAAAAAARAQENAGSIGRDGSKAVRSRAFWRAAGETGATRGRGFSRSGSVRFARRRSSGGSSGFYRDAGYQGEDHWQSVSASLPDLAPRLPAQWTGGNANLAEPSQPLSPAPPARGAFASQASHGNGGGGSGGVTADARVSSSRSMLGSSRSGRGVGIGSSGRGIGGSGVGSSIRGGRSFNMSGDQLGGSDHPDASSSAGGAATAAASALLYGVGGSKRATGSSRQSMFAIGRESWRSTGQGLGAGTAPTIPLHKRSSSRLASFVRRESINNGAPRLQLSDHGVLPLLEASVTGNGELEALVADLRKASRDEHVRALINYVCAPAAGLEGGSMPTAGAAPPSRVRADDAGPEIALKRFGLQILRAVIETAPPEGDVAKGLPGMWQAGGGARSGVTVNDGQGGQKVDEEAIRLAREKAGRKQQQERIARLGGGRTILLFVGGLSSSSTRDTAADAFMLAVEMLRGGNSQVQEHFFAVLRDSRQDECFFAAVTNFIRSSVARLADARRRRIVLRRRGVAERQVRRMAAGSARSGMGKSGRRQRRQRRRGGGSANLGNKAGAGGGEEKGGRKAGRGGGGGGGGGGGVRQRGRFGTEDGIISRGPEFDSAYSSSRSIQLGGGLGTSWPGTRRAGAAAAVQGAEASKAAAERVPKGSTGRKAKAAIANMSISVVEPGGGGGVGGVGADGDGAQRDEDETPPALPAAGTATGEGEEEVSSLSALMEFLRLLCENHYLGMQDYMRTQPDNLRSYNLVSEVSGLLQGLQWVVLDDVSHWGIDSRTIDLAYTVVRTLVEFAQGNEGNKLTIATPNLSTSINDIFTQTFDGRGNGDSAEAAYKRGECRVSPSRFKHQAFVLLYSLIEGCHEPSIFSTLVLTLDFEAVLGVLQETSDAFVCASRDYRMKERRYFKLRRAKWWAGMLLVVKGWRISLAEAAEEFKVSEEKWRSARLGYSTPVLFLRALFDGAKAEHPKLCAREETRFKFFLDEWEDQVRSIEITREGRLEKMYFVVPDWCRAHWKKTPVVEMRDQMKKRCARATSSPRWKLLKFYQHGECMLSQMAYLHALQATSLHVITVHEVMWSFLAFLLALAINFIDMIVSSKDEGKGSRLYKMSTVVIGAGHVLISCLRLVAFMYNRQQKWLMEQRLPDLTFLRRVLRLSPLGGGKDVAHPGKHGDSPLRQSQSQRGLDSASDSGRHGGVVRGDSNDAGAKANDSIRSNSSRVNDSIRSSGSRVMDSIRSSRSRTGSQGKQRRVMFLERVGKVASYNSSGGESGGLGGSSSSNSGSDMSDSDEEQQGNRGRAGGRQDVGGRGKEVSRVDRLTRVTVMLRCSKWYVMYAFVSLLGLSLSLAGSYKARSACYAFCLLDVSVRYRAMHRVLRAVSRNWAMLWQTAMLVVIVLFIFAAVGTAGFEEDFALGTAAEAVKPEGEDFAGCATLGQCSITFFQYALRGDLGTYLFLVTDDDDAWHRVRRFLFDVSYWVLVPLLLLNMVSGVILDSFAQLRDEEAALKAELKSRCVVCGISRNEFDRGGNVFYNHVTHDHCMWNYVLVRAYLNFKPELEHTGQESYVHRMQRGGPDSIPDVSYFPIGEAGVLDKMADSTTKSKRGGNYGGGGGEK